MRSDAFVALGNGLSKGGGHHGGRILVVIVLVVAIVVVVMRLLERRRGAPRNPPPSQGTPLAPDTSSLTRRPVPSHTASSMPAAAQPGRPTAGTAATISVRSLSKRYSEKVAVDQLSFDVYPGQVTGFLGPNGAGKSTTMRMIMGLDAPSGGSVTINGGRYHDLAWPLREVGALLEARAINPGRSARNHLWMLAQTNHISRSRVDEVLALVGLSDVAHQRAGQFSLGMGQRLGIAAALLGDPGVLLFDEPVNGLDTDGIRWVRQLLRGLAAEGRTVFVSSHLMSEMAMTADHVVVIARGRLIADLPTAEFTARYTTASVRVRSPQPELLIPVLTAHGASAQAQDDGAITVSGLTAQAIGDLACYQSIALHELTAQTATLEEAFVESTEGQLEYAGHTANSAGADSAAANESTQEQRHD